MSPLDFWTPGQRLVASAIRGLTNRVGGAVSAGFRLLPGPTKELAKLSAERMMAGKALPGIPVPTTGLLPVNVKHLNRRTIIAGEDMIDFQNALIHSKPVSGFYDLTLHGNPQGFELLVKTKANGEKIFREVSVREVADAIRPHLAPGDKIRLVSCATGCSAGGPAQQLANELNRTVWAPSKTVDVVARGKRVIFRPDDNGKFYEFVPHRGDATLVGEGGGKVTGNVLYGQIPHAK